MLLPLTLVMIGKIIKKKKYSVIINTLGGSALGKMLQRWCNHQRVILISIVRSALRAKELMQLGATYVLNSESDGFLDELFTATEKLKPRCCFDGVGGKIGKLAMNSLVEEGVMYVFNTAESNLVEVPGIEVYKHKKKIKGIWVLDWFAKLNERKKQKYFKKIQKKSYLYRVDNVDILPVYDFLPDMDQYIAAYFSENLPRNKILLDFTELSQIQPLFSPRSSRGNSIFSQPEIKSSSSSENFDETEEFHELISSYSNPIVKSLLASFTVSEKTNEVDNIFIKLEDGSVYEGHASKYNSTLLKPKEKSKKSSSNRIPDGFGTVYFTNGDIYQGEFDCNQKKGKGRIFYSSGDWFEGSWKEDTPAGAGIYHFRDGSTIQGNFLHSEVIGVGIEICPNGDRYQGYFQAKKRHGKGELVSEYWTFIGKFRSGEIYGDGVVRYNDGKEFTGEFENGIGNGVLKYPDLTSFEGKIKDFLEDGEGELVNSEGVHKKGVWERGELKYFIEECESPTRILESEKEVENYEGTVVELENPEDLITVLVIK